MTLTAYDPRTLDILAAADTTTLLDATAGQGIRSALDIPADQAYLCAPSTTVNALNMQGSRA